VGWVMHSTPGQTPLGHATITAESSSLMGVDAGRVVPEVVQRTLLSSVTSQNPSHTHKETRTPTNFPPTHLAPSRRSEMLTSTASSRHVATPPCSSSIGSRYQASGARNAREQSARGGDWICGTFAFAVHAPVRVCLCCLPIAAQRIVGVPSSA
jgi:hypothetical protein